MLDVSTVGALGMSTDLCIYMSRHVNKCIGCVLTGDALGMSTDVLCMSTDELAC